MLTQEDKQIVAKYMNWPEDEILIGYATGPDKMAHFDLNDAGLCVKKMEANGDADEFEMFLVERQESGDCLGCFLVWSYNAENFFKSMTVWLRERKEK